MLCFVFHFRRCKYIVNVASMSGRAGRVMMFPQITHEKPLYLVRLTVVI